MQVIRYISWHLPPTCAFNKSFHNVYVNMQMWFMSPSVTRVRSVQKPREQIMNHKVTAEVLGDYRNIQTLSRIAKLVILRIRSQTPLKSLRPKTAFLPLHWLTFIQILSWRIEISELSPDEGVSWPSALCWLKSGGVGAQRKQPRSHLSALRCTLLLRRRLLRCLNFHRVVLVDSFSRDSCLDLASCVDLGQRSGCSGWLGLAASAC